MPSLLHGQAEARGHRRPRRALRAPVRKARSEEEGLTLSSTGDTSSPVVPDRSAFHRAKLHALVATVAGDGDGEDSGFPHGAALRRSGDGWVLAEERADRALGPAIVWARREGVDRLHVCAAAPTSSDLARRAAQFEVPPSVWSIEGRALAPAAAADPQWNTDIDALPPDIAGFVDLIRAVGAEAVVEGGTLRADVLGLEVARVVTTDTGPRLEIGVGKHDRWAQLEVHGEGDVPGRLADAVAVVRRERVPGASHPFASLAPERWLRCVVVAHPTLAEARELRPAPSPVVRDNLRQRAPAPALGTDPDGRAVVIVCSTGIDPDLVPIAADARMGLDPAARLRIVVPEGDDHWVTRELAAALAVPAEVVTIGADWRSL